jgi:mannose-6-phosphate isomerase-like protein (cupin superfamily)
VGDGLFAAGPGAVAFAPGGVAHTLANLGDAPARYLLLCTPAGFEAYFGRLAAEAAGEDPPAWALAPTPPVTTVGGHIGDRGDVAAATPIAPAGDQFNVVVHGEQNDGRVGLMLNRMPPGAAGPPLHHHAFDEMFYVLDGELAFRVEDEIVTKRSGELVFVPGGVTHAFTNRGDAPARFVIACTPAGFERHFARRAAAAAGVDPPAWAMLPIPSVTKVGPPIGG